MPRVPRSAVVRRPKPPRDAGVSAVLAYLRELEDYATALETIIRGARAATTASTAEHESEGL